MRRYAKFWKLMQNKYHLRHRYLVMEIGTESYLVDTDSFSFLLGYFCPIFYWLSTHKAYQIDLESWELNKNFLSKGKQQDIIGNRRFLGTALTTLILMRIVNSIDFGNTLTLNLPIVIMFLSLVTGLGALIYIKIVISKRNRAVYESMQPYLSDEVRFIIRPQSLLECVKILLLYLVIILLILFSFMTFSTIGSNPGTRNLWPGYVVGLYLFNLYLYINLNILANRHHFVKITSLIDA